MQHVQNLIPAYLGGQLDAAATASVQEHCAECRACARALAESRFAWEALGGDEVPPAPRPAWPALSIALARRAGRPRRVLTPGFAASALALACAGLLLGSLARGLTHGHVAWPWAAEPVVATGGATAGGGDASGAADTGGGAATAAGSGALSALAALTEGTRLVETDNEATLDGWLLALADESAAESGGASGGTTP